MNLKIFALSILTSIAIATLSYFIGRRKGRRFDVIDSFWGILFIGISMINFIATDTKSFYKVATLLIVFIWGLRLSVHIFRRWLRTTSEDPRYVQMRKNWPKKLFNLQIYARIYILQAVLAVIVCLPIITILNSTHQPNLLFIVGAIVWILGFIFETVADKQLKNFIEDPKNKGKLMTKGLWSVSRHPNYFGEITLWWGFAIMSLSVKNGWLGILGTALISFLIIFVSGVPLAEKRTALKPGWAEYTKKTNKLLPLRR